MALFMAFTKQKGKNKSFLSFPDKQVKTRKKFKTIIQNQKYKLEVEILNLVDQDGGFFSFYEWE